MKINLLTYVPLSLSLFPFIPFPPALTKLERNVFDGPFASRSGSSATAGGSTAAGYEWVGWRNDTYGTEGKPVEMIFEFDSVRNFSAIVLHTNNMFTKDVQVSQLHESSVSRVMYVTFGKYSESNRQTNTVTIKSF